VTHLIAPLAEPYSPQELADFEQLIFASSNDHPAVRLLVRAALATFFREHGKAKCDLMMAALSKFHDNPKRPDA
jgi:hypothetical protein